MIKQVFVDESHKILDILTSRSMICYVEFDRKIDVDRAIKTVREKIFNDQLRFDLKENKLHYNEFNPSQKTIACNLISKLSFRCKLFVDYCHSIDVEKKDSFQKRHLLNKSIKFMRDKQLKDEDKIYIEKAKGIYDNLKLPSNTELTTDYKELMLISDIVLGVFSDYCGQKERGPQSLVNYQLIKEKIRLQVINSNSLHLPPLSRHTRV